MLISLAMANNVQAEFETEHNNGAEIVIALNEYGHTLSTAFPSIMRI